MLKKWKNSTNNLLVDYKNLPLDEGGFLFVEKGNRCYKNEQKHRYMERFFNDMLILNKRGFFDIIFVRYETKKEMSGFGRTEEKHLQAYRKKPFRI